jgi:hypothetical protein
MKATQNPEEFWRYAVLFAKVVDGRYSLWESDYGDPGETFLRFFPTVETGWIIESRNGKTSGRTPFSARKYLIRSFANSYANLSAPKRTKSASSRLHRMMPRVSVPTRQGAAWKRPSVRPA